MADKQMYKQQGQVIKWQEDKGFGFIKTQAGESIFFHSSEFKASRRPTIGDEVVFSVGYDKQGRVQAKQVQELSVVQQQMAEKNKQIRQRNSQKSQQAEFEEGKHKRAFLGIGFYSVLILLAIMEDLSWLVVGWYVVLGIVTYLTYAKDKAAAQNNEWRTPEMTLHILSALGGWVGALVAQTYLRHKSQKPDFRMGYYLTVVINLAGLLFIMAGGGLKAFKGLL